MNLNDSPQMPRNTMATRQGALRKALCGGFLLGLAVALSGCSLLGPSSEHAPLSNPPSEATGSRLPTAAGTLDTLGLVAYAASMQGKPYRNAGDSPTEGFDCSGLVHHVFRQFDLMLPRSAATMAAVLPRNLAVRTPGHRSVVLQHPRSALFACRHLFGRRPVCSRAKP